MKAKDPHLNLAILAGLALAGSLCCRVVSAESAPQVRPPDRRHAPKLIVQITLDQFRGEIMGRMDPMFSGGLRTMLDEGFYFANARVDHGLTVSHPGHATLATGAHPASHGLVANEIWVHDESTGWGWTEIVADKEERILGFPERVGPSARALSIPTVGTWLKWASPETRAITISNSSFAAATQAGWVSDGAYWFDGESGRMVTSTFYMDAYPGWVDSFNEGPLRPFHEIDQWQVAVPPGFRHLARSDDAEYEADGGESALFPHQPDFSPLQDSENTSSEQEVRSQWLRGTPFSDQAVLLFAVEAIQAERLGQRGATDYLNIGIGSTDSVGHDYGPRSLEQLDVFYRLDQWIGEFFAELDRMVGQGEWVVVVSGDHGSTEALESRLERGLSARRIARSEIDQLLDEIEQIAISEEMREDELIARIEAHLESKDYVAEALTQDELMGRTPTDFAGLDAMRKSFRPGLTPDFPLWGSGQRDHHPARYGIWVVFNEYATFDFATSVHGSPYLYDQRVPIVFYGAGVAKGRSDMDARTIDIAPTLSWLAGVESPETVDGEILHLISTEPPADG